MQTILLRVVLVLALITSTLPAGEVREVKPGSPERKAIMDTMRAPVSKRIGKPVVFTGTVKISGEWATFSGDAEPADGIPPKGEAADALSLDLCAVLRLEKGKWKLVVWDFAGDIGVWDHARMKYPAIPKDLIP